MKVFTGLFHFCGLVVWIQTGRRIGFHSFACEKPISNEPPAPNSVPIGKTLLAQLKSEFGIAMKTIFAAIPSTILAAFPPRFRLSSMAESRVIFWNLLFTIALSTGLLLLYLKRILFDF
jgi:hypothetical protein